ncbi:MAG TPA: FecR domain-containing protein [Gemmatimonadaceae bacterium]|nr:FecR domain-containing protein [Gemmatimonadaceae bacterium]
MPKDEDLIRLIEGECTAEEAAAIQRWVSADPERAALLRQLRTVWRLTGGSPQRWNLDAARKRLQSAGAGVDDAEPLPNAGVRAPGPARRWYLSRWPMRAAAAVFALAAGLYWAARMSPEYPDREYTTAPGQRAELSLRDGSRVLLSVDTRLRVPRDFGEATRTVELSGQAYFVVRHDAQRPFLVQTRRGVAEDLGTAFDVRAYDHESFVQVVVAEGAVALQAARAREAGPARLTLYARDRGVIDAGGTVRRSPLVTVDDYVAWTRGALVFHNAPVDSVVAELRRWYDVDLRVETASLGTEPITITFTMESAGEAIAALAKVLDAEIARSNGVVRLAPRRSRVRSQEK